jgi:hypothetical protein
MLSSRGLLAAGMAAPSSSMALQTISVTAAANSE